MNETKPKTILFIGAHFDDEFPISALLRRHKKAGDDVYFLYATRPTSKKWNGIRLKELRHALHLLHVPYSHCRSLPFIDRRSYAYTEELFYDVMQEISEIKPDLIYLPAFEGGNIDHDIIHVLVVKAVEKLKLKGHIKIKEFSLYNSAHQHNFIAPHGFCCFIPRDDVKTERLNLTWPEKKFAFFYFLQHFSQFWHIMGYILMFSKRKDIFSYIEVRNLPHYNYQHRPTPVLTYERYQDVTFGDYLQGVNFLFTEKFHEDRLPTLNNEPGFRKLFHKENWVEGYTKKLFINE